MAEKDDKKTLEKRIQTPRDTTGDNKAEAKEMSSLDKMWEQTAARKQLEKDMMAGKALRSGANENRWNKFRDLSKSLSETQKIEEEKEAPGPAADFLSNKEKTVLELKNKVALQNEEITGLKANISHVTSTLSSYEKDVAALKSLTQKLTAENKEKDAQIAGLREKDAMFAKEKVDAETFKATIGELNASIVEHENQLASLQDDLFRNKENLTNKEKELASALNELNELKVILKEEKEKALTLNTDLDKKQQEIASLKSEILQHQATSISASRDLGTMIKTLENDKGIKDAKIKELNAELEKKNGEIDSLKKERDASSAAISDAEKNFKDLQESNQALIKEKDAAYQEKVACFRQLEKDQATLNKNLKALEDKLAGKEDELAKNNDANKEKILNMKAEFKTAQDALNQDLRSFKAENAKQAKTIEKITSARSILQEEKRTLSQENRKYKTKLAKLQEKIDQGIIQANSERIKELEKELNLSTKKNEELKQAKDDLRTMNQDINKENKRLAAQVENIEKVTSDNKNLINENKKLAVQVELFQKHLEDKENEAALTIKNEVEKLNEEKTKLAEKLRQSEAEIAKLKDSAVITKEDYKEGKSTLENDLKELNKANNANLKKLEKLSAKYQDTNKLKLELARENKKLFRQLGNIQEKYNAQISELKDAKEINKETANFAEKLNQRELELAQIKKNYDELKLATSVLKKDYASINAKYAPLALQDADVKALKRANSRLEKTLEKKLADLKAAKQDLKASLRSVKSLTAKNNKYEATAAKTALKLENLKENLAKTKALRKKEKDAALNYKSLTEDQINILKIKLQVKDYDIKDLNKDYDVKMLALKNDCEKEKDAALLQAETMFKDTIAEKDVSYENLAKAKENELLHIKSELSLKHQQELTSASQKYEEDIALKEEELLKAKEDIALKDEELLKAKEEFSAKEEALKAAIAEKDSEILNIKTELQEKTEEFDSVIAEKDEEIREADEKISAYLEKEKELSEDAEALKAELFQLKAIDDGLKEEIKRIGVENKDLQDKLKVANETLKFSGDSTLKIKCDQFHSLLISERSNHLQVEQKLYKELENLSNEMVLIKEQLKQKEEKLREFEEKKANLDLAGYIAEGNRLLELLLGGKKQAVESKDNQFAKDIAEIKASIEDLKALQANDEEKEADLKEQEMREYSQKVKDASLHFIENLGLRYDAFGDIFSLINCYRNDCLRMTDAMLNELNLLTTKKLSSDPLDKTYDAKINLIRQHFPVLASERDRKFALAAKKTHPGKVSLAGNENGLAFIGEEYIKHLNIYLNFKDNLHQQIAKEEELAKEDLKVINDEAEGLGKECRMLKTKLELARDVEYYNPEEKEKNKILAQEIKAKESKMQNLGEIKTKQITGYHNLILTELKACLDVVSERENELKEEYKEEEKKARSYIADAKADYTFIPHGEERVILSVDEKRESILAAKAEEEEKERLEQLKKLKEIEPPLKEKKEATKPAASSLVVRTKPYYAPVIEKKIVKDETHETKEARFQAYRESEKLKELKERLNENLKTKAEMTATYNRFKDAEGRAVKDFKSIRKYKETKESLRLAREKQDILYQELSAIDPRANRKEYKKKRVESENIGNRVIYIQNNLKSMFKDKRIQEYDSILKKLNEFNEQFTLYEQRIAELQKEIAQIERKETNK